jgi:hypothetical protein
MRPHPSVVVSTGRRNACIKSFCWNFISQGCTWPFGEPTRLFIWMGLLIHRQAVPFGKYCIHSIFPSNIECCVDRLSRQLINGHGRRTLLARLPRKVLRVLWRSIGHNGGPKLLYLLGSVVGDWGREDSVSETNYAAEWFLNAAVVGA